MMRTSRFYSITHFGFVNFKGSIMSSNGVEKISMDHYHVSLIKGRQFLSLSFCFVYIYKHFLPRHEHITSHKILWSLYHLGCIIVLANQTGRNFVCYTCILVLYNFTEVRWFFYKYIYTFYFFSSKDAQFLLSAGDNGALISWLMVPGMEQWLVDALASHALVYLMCDSLLIMFLRKDDAWLSVIDMMWVKPYGLKSF